MFPDPDYNVLCARVCLPATSRNAPLPDNNAGLAASEKVYVSGDVHVNTMEGFWSLVKRGIGGVYHSVSAKHLQGYLNEYAWRYSHRGD